MKVAPGALPMEQHQLSDRARSAHYSAEIGTGSFYSVTCHEHDAQCFGSNRCLIASSAAHWETWPDSLAGCYNAMLVEELRLDVQIRLITETVREVVWVRPRLDSRVVLSLWLIAEARFENECRAR